jgi:hypothetical protein
VLQDVVEAGDRAAAEHDELELRLAAERGVHVADLGLDLVVLFSLSLVRTKACSPMGTPHLMIPASGVTAPAGTSSSRGMPAPWSPM